MTINHCMDKLDKISTQFANLICRNADVWSDGAAKGYAIAAAERIGLTQDQTFKLIREMNRAMDLMDVDQAEDKWAFSPY